MIDEFKAAIFLAAVFINRQAGWVLVVHLASELIQSSPLHGFDTALTLAALYSLSAVYIPIKSEIRHVLISLSLINWLCAVDILAAPATITLFSSNYGNLINFLDLMAIYYLLGGGGLNLVGKHNISSHYRAANLYLPK